MKRALKVLIPGLLLLLVTAHYSDAEPGAPPAHTGGRCAEWMPMPPPMRHGPMEITEEMPMAGHPVWKDILSLGFDEKQKDAIKEIKRRAIKELIKKQADEHIAEIDLRDLLDLDNVDMKAVETKLKQITALKTETQLAMIKALEEVKSKLTPEQKKKTKEKLGTEPDFGPPFPGVMPRHMRMPSTDERSKQD